MAKRAAIFPSWVRSIDAAIENGTTIFVGCTGCREWQELDLAKLRHVVPGDYCLINRRCRCRLTPGCEGWNRFFYLHGVVRPLWDHAASARWIQTTF